jgi:hypothetical protein
MLKANVVPLKRTDISFNFRRKRSQRRSSSTRLFCRIVFDDIGNDEGMVRVKRGGEGAGSIWFSG